MERLWRHPFDAKNPAMMKLAEFWPQCLSLLAAELTEQQFDFSIAPLTVGEEDGQARPGARAAGAGCAAAFD